METQHSAGKIVKNTVIFTGALVLQKILSFAYFLYLSSRLRPEDLGAYVWALSFTTLFSIGMDLGLSAILTREAAKNSDSDEKYLKNVLGLKLPMAIITLIVTYAVLFITKNDWQTRALILGASAVMTFDAFSVIYYSFLRAKQKLSYEAWGIIMFQIIAFGAGVILWEATSKITLVMLALALASFANLLLSVLSVKIKFGYSLAPAIQAETARFFLHLMPAFALSGIFVKIYNVADSVILGYIAGNAAVGLFSIPAKVITAFQALIPGAFQAAIYPGMSNFYVSSKEKLYSLFKASFNYLGVISFPLALGLYAAAPEIVGTIWPKYIAAIPTFRIMALGIPAVFLAFPTGLLLRACDMQNKNTWNRGVITAAAVALNLILIPAFGVYGAGITFLLVNSLLLVLDTIFIRKILHLDYHRAAWYFMRIFIASFAMAIAVQFLISAANLYAAIAAGITLYAILIFIFRVLRMEDLKFFKRALWSR